ncbi:hypothetical protein D3C81_1955040 [compost metagenome]
MHRDLLSQFLIRNADDRKWLHMRVGRRHLRRIHNGFNLLAGQWDIFILADGKERTFRQMVPLETMV